MDLVNELKPILQKSVTFQKEYVKTWNANVDSVSQVIYLPVDKHEKISNDGILQVMMELFLDFGFITKLKYENEKETF